MENNHDIDKKFSEASQAIEEPATFPGFDKVWAKVDEKLDQKEEKKRILPVWLPYGIAVSLIIGLGAFYFINKNSEEKFVPSIVQKATPLEAPSHQDIAQIDSTIQSNIKKEIKNTYDLKKDEDVLVYINSSSVGKKAPSIVFENLNSNSVDKTRIPTKPDNIVYLEPDGDGVLDKEDTPTHVGEVVITNALGISKKSELTGSTQTIGTKALSQNSNYGFYNNSNAVNSSPQIATGYYQNNAPTSNLKNEHKKEKRKRNHTNSISNNNNCTINISRSNN